MGRGIPCAPRCQSDGWPWHGALGILSTFLKTPEHIWVRLTVPAWGALKQHYTNGHVQSCPACLTECHPEWPLAIPTPTSWECLEMPPTQIPVSSVKTD